MRGSNLTSCAGGRHNNAPVPCKLTLTLKVVSESRVTWATSVPIVVFLGCSRLRPDVRDTDRCQTDRRQTRIIALCLRPKGAGT